MDLATAWAIKLTGLKDQEKFKAMGWGLRTWDQWYFNDCDDRFGTDRRDFESTPTKSRTKFSKSRANRYMQKPNRTSLKKPG
jgi:hypothetical protein